MLGDGMGLDEASTSSPGNSSRLYALECITIERLTLALVATAAVGRDRDVEAPRRSEGAKERDQIALLLAGQFRAEHQIEELNRIIERQQAPVVHVGRRILDDTVEFFNLVLGTKLTGEEKR